MLIVAWPTNIYILLLLLFFFGVRLSGVGLYDLINYDGARVRVFPSEKPDRKKTTIISVKGGRRRKNIKNIGIGKKTCEPKKQEEKERRSEINTIKRSIHPFLLVSSPTDGLDDKGSPYLLL